MSGTPPEIVDGYHNQVRADVAPFVPRSGGTLVDIGGGTGATAAHMKRLGLADRVGVVDAVAGTAHPDVDFSRVADLADPAAVQAVAEAEGPFRTILCLDILEHLVDPWALVAQLHEVLEPGGQIVASIPNVRHYRVSGGLFLGDRWNLTDAGVLDRTHLRFFTRRTAVDLMTHSGLELQEVGVPARERHRRRLAWFHRLTPSAVGSLVDVQYVVRVRRTD